MNVFELFSGIGAPRAALKRAGILHKSVGFSEIDKYAIKSYCAIHGESALMNYGDITKIKELPKTDLLFHGSPCQDFSVAGKGNGGDEGSGTRSSLMWETVRLIDKERPTYVVWENVKGALVQKNRHNFDKYLEQMTEFGYNNYWKVLNTKDFGVPQNRERIFCVSIIKSADKVEFKFPKAFDNGIRLKHLLETNVDEKYYIRDEKCAKLLSKLNGIPQEGLFSIGNTNPSGKGMNGTVWAGNVSPTLTTNKGEGHKIIVPIDMTYNDPRHKEISNCISARTDRGISNRKSEGTGVLEIETDEFDESILEFIEKDGIFDKANRLYSVNGIATTLTAASEDEKISEPNECKRLGNIYGEQFGTGYAGNVWDSNGISPAIMTMQGGGRQPHIIARYRIRKLTPKECWRLQGFADDDFDKAQTVNSNSQLYKQAGNSITVDVLVHLFESLFKAQKRTFEIGEQLSIF